MTNKTDVWQGTLALMVLKTLSALGPQHGYGIAKRMEQAQARAGRFDFFRVGRVRK